MSGTKLNSGIIREAARRCGTGIVEARSALDAYWNFVYGYMASRDIWWGDEDKDKEGLAKSCAKINVERFGTFECDWKSYYKSKFKSWRKDTLFSRNGRVSRPVRVKEYLMRHPEIIRKIIRRGRENGMEMDGSMLERSVMERRLQRVRERISRKRESLRRSGEDGNG